MNFLLRIFAGYALLIALGAYLGLRLFTNELKPSVRQSVEELLVDNANLFAELVDPADLGADAFAAAVERFKARHFSALIYGLPKDEPDLRVYVTDQRGIVRFDSNGVDLGEDYSSWRDVALTLRGEYGARSTRDDPADPLTATLYVAAPIKRAGEVIGVVTVGKSSASFEPFIERSRRQVVEAGGILIAVALGIALLFSYWMARDVRRLSRFAADVSAGKRVAPPRYWRGGELAALSAALEKMRAALEGKAHVEKFAQLLTHELKSPLAAIRGAAELLEEEVPAQDRERFVQNIKAESARMGQIVERILNLAVIEHRRELQDVTSVSLLGLVEQACRAQQTRIDAKQLKVTVRVASDAAVEGERFLLEQAVANLVDNAVAFTPGGGQIEIDCTSDEHAQRLRIRDSGAGIPGFAQERLFERFFSMPRPDGGGKSTGLGLALVREVAELHGGAVSLHNHAGGGASAELVLPRTR